MKDFKDTAKDLLAFVKASPSAYHAIHNLAELLKDYEQLSEQEKWDLKPGGKYYVVRHVSSLIAFRIPEKKYTALYITAAHSDSPTFRIKPNPQMKAEGCYTRLNTEKYGGMLMSTWFDRPLSVAGRVIVEEKGKLVSRLVNIDRDLLLIPSVAIHMNRNSNDGIKYDAQVDTIPLFGGDVRDDCFMGLVADAAGVKKEAVLGQDLYLYVREPGRIWGAFEEFISAGRLDDLQCAFATLSGFLQAGRSTDKLCVCCVFDNEEVGSLTSQGADSTFLADVLERINESLGYTGETYKRAVRNGFMISADNAHAVHPSHPELTDPTNKPVLNGGVVMKFNAAQKYGTDGFSEAMFRSLCEKAKVPCQIYVNRSNMAGGSTLGNIANRHVSISTVDCGLPQLSMHSAYETAGVKDTLYMIQVCREFFS